MKLKTEKERTLLSKRTLISKPPNESSAAEDRPDILKLTSNVCPNVGLLSEDMMLITGTALADALHEPYITIQSINRKYFNFFIYMPFLFMVLISYS
jgi:hypothetical protein